MSRLAGRVLVLLIFLAISSAMNVSGQEKNIVALEDVLLLNEAYQHFDVVLLATENNPNDLKYMSIRSPDIVQGIYTQWSSFDHFIEEHNMDKLVIVLLSNTSLQSSSELPFENVYDMKGKLRTFVILVWPTIIPCCAASADLVGPILESCENGAPRMDSNVFMLFRLYSPNTLQTTNESWEFYCIKELSVTRRVLSTDGPIDFDVWQIKDTSRRSNFFGVTIAAISILEGVESHEEDTKYVDPEADELEFESGFSVSLYRDLKFTLQFTELALGGNWLMTNEDATELKGTSGNAISTGQADICIQQEKMQKELAFLVTFLHPTYPLNVIAFVRDTTVDTLDTIYFLPFHWFVWICILLMAFLIWMTLKIVSYCRTKRMHIAEVDRILQGEFLFFIISGCFAQRGWHIFPASIPLKTIFLTSYFAGSVLFAAFTAVLVSKFSLRSYGVTSFDDLLQHKYSFIVNNESFSMTNYAKDFEAYHGRQMSVVLPHTIMETILTTKTAFLYYLDSVKEIFSTYDSNMSQEEFLCDVVTSFPVRKGFPSAMTLKKGSPVKEIFNQKIVKLKEYGLNERYKKQYECKTQPRCLPKGETSISVLGMQDIHVAFILWSAGFTLAFVLVYIERYHFRRNSVIVP